ncbi:recombinase family protein [Rhodococcus sp. NPDC056960]|uniref:recombinase family protein n=1 Tax=Rhodococcus sp. NPDC056960 TaxID=3345982 RepID=UPI003635EC94
MLIGYARVSSADQNPDHQVDALRRAGVAAADIHVDHAGGAKASRPQLDLVLQLLRDGDILVITRLDRLGRSMLHLITLGADLRERGMGPAGARAGHRHRHRRGPRHVRDAVGPGRIPARAHRREHP